MSRVTLHPEEMMCAKVPSANSRRSLVIITAAPALLRGVSGRADGRSSCLCPSMFHLHLPDCTLFCAFFLKIALMFVLLCFTYKICACESVRSRQCVGAGVGWGRDARGFPCSLSGRPPTCQRPALGPRTEIVQGRRPA